METRTPHTSGEPVQGGESNHPKYTTSWPRSQAVERPDLTPDRDQAERFLRLLDEDAERFTFQTFDDNKNRKDQHLVRVLNGTLDAHWNVMCELNRKDAGVYVTVNETDLQGRKKTNITRVRALFQEQDRAGCPELPTAPHIEVESSPGKHHRYVLVDGCPLDGFNPLQERMVQDYGSDPDAKDISRVLRLPGFFHQKDPNRPHLVRITAESGELPLPYAEAIRIFPPVIRKPRPAPADTGTPPDMAEVQSALSVLNPDRGYNDWLAVGFALHNWSGGSAAGLEAWDTWSSNGALYRDGECEYRWSTFDIGGGVTIKTLFGMAVKTGWRWQGGQRKEWAGTSYAGAEQEQVFAAAKKCRDFGSHIPEHILKPGGLLEEFGDYVERSRAVSSRLFSLAIGIAALGALIGQKISIFNLRSNFYFLLLARSGIGKDAAQAALLALTDVESLLKEYFDNCDVTSDTAILKLLERQPVCLSVLDEVGFFFNENKNERSPGRKITQLMLKLFSSTDRSEGKRYADSRNDVILPYHHYSLVGSTTPEVIFKAFTSSDAASGLIPRCLFVAEDSEPVRPKLNTSRDGEEELARRLAEIAELEIPVVRNGNLDLAGRPVPKEIPVSDDAQKLFEAFSDKAHALKVKHNRDSIKGPIYNRCFEHGAKLALVHAVSRCGAAVVEDQILPEDAAFGIELAEILTEWTAIQFEANLVDSDFAELCKRTIEVMEADLGAGRKSTTWRTIARALRRSKSDLEKALEALELRGDVGRCKHEYRPGQFTDAFQLLEDYSP